MLMRCFSKFDERWEENKHEYSNSYIKLVDALAVGKVLKLESVN